MFSELDDLRSSSDKQEIFLREMLRKNRPGIYNLAARSVSPRSQLFCDLMGGKRQQAFQLGAYKGLVTFRDTDDGRGRNNLAGYCSWKATKTCLDRIRQAIQELKSRSEEVSAGALTEPTRDPIITRGIVVINERHNEIGALRAIKVEDAIDDIITEDMIKEFLDKLSPKDRLVAELFRMGYGPQQRNNDPGENRGKRRNYVEELIAATGYSEPKLMASIGRLREIAMAHWG